MGFVAGLLLALAIAAIVLICMMVALLVAVFLAWNFLRPLVALIPLLPQLAQSLRLSANIVRGSSQVMETVQTGLDHAADKLTEAGTAAGNFSMQVPRFDTSPFAGGPLNYVTNVSLETKNPLQPVSAPLTNAVANLKHNLDTTIDPAQMDMAATAAALDALADAIDLVAPPAGP